ncbi:MAG TPA: hypothetical protein VIJ25_21090 [Methylococcales bacterium]
MNDCRAQDIADLSRMSGDEDEELLGQVRTTVKIGNVVDLLLMSTLIV